MTACIASAIVSTATILGFALADALAKTGHITKGGLR